MAAGNQREAALGRGGGGNEEEDFKAIFLWKSKKEKHSLIRVEIASTRMIKARESVLVLEKDRRKKKFVEEKKQGENGLRSRSVTERKLCDEMILIRTLISELKKKQSDINIQYTM